MAKKIFGKTGRKGALQRDRSSLRALEEGEERYRCLAELLSSAIAIQQKDLFVYINSAGLKLWGANRPDQILGKRWMDLVHPECRQAIVEILQRLEESKDPAKFQKIKILRLDGKIMEVEGRSSLVPYKGAKAVQWIFGDLTEGPERADKLFKGLRETMRGDEKISILLQTLRVALEQRDFRSAAEAVFHVCKDLTGATSGYISLLTPDGKENEAVFLDPGPELCQVDPDLPMPIRGIRGEAYRLGQAILENQFPRSPYVQFLPPGHSHLENVLMAPLKIEGRVVGLLGLSNKPGGFSPEDIQIASAFGDIAAVALVQKRAEEKIRLSEKRFQVALRGSPIMVFNQDVDLRYTWVYNPLLGPTAEAMMGKKDEEIFPSKEAARLTEIKHQAFKSGQTIREEISMDHGGRRFYYDLTVEPLRGEEGQILGITCATVDITERKRMEREAEHLASFPRVNPNPVLEIGAGGEILFANEAAAHVVREARAAGAQIFFPEDLNRILGEMQKGEKGTLYREVKIQNKLFGENIYLNPQFGTVRIYANNITRRKEAEEALKRERDFITAIMNTAGALIVVLDREGRIVTFNRHCEQLTGYSFTEVKGKPFWDIFLIPEEVQAVQGVFRELQAGKFPNSHENYWLTKNGGRRLISWSNTCVLGKDGSVEYIIGAGLDITERRKTQEILEKNKAKFELLAETASSLLSAEDPLKIISDLCRKVMEHLDCQAFLNFIADPVRQCLHLKAYAGIPDETARKIQWLPYGASVCGCSARDGIRIVAENIPGNPDPQTELVRSLGIQAYACHPLVSQGKIIGTLSFGTRSKLNFTEEELAIMKTFSDQVTATMERVFLMEEIRRSRDELESKVQERTRELSRAYRELAERSRILDSFFKYTITPLALLDRDFNFIRVNEAYAKAGQRKVSEFPGRNHFELYPSDAKGIFEQVVKTKIPYQAIARPFTYPDHPEWGETYWDWTLTPILDYAGEVEYLVFSLMDVTEGKKAEQRIRQEEALLRNILELLPIGVWIADRNGTITYGNPEGQRIWGGHRYVGIDRFGEYKGRWVGTGKIIEPDEWAVARAIRKGETSLNEEIEIECFDGSRKFILNSAIPLRNAQNEISGAFVINVDITERRKTEQAVRQTQKMQALGTLAGGIAHDFNNILMAIVVNTELALMDTPAEGPQRKCLQDVLKAAQVGQSLVKQITTFSRPSDSTWHSIPVASVIQEGLRLVKTSIPPNIRIKENLEASSGMAQVNPNQIHQILVNLCSNAVHAMRDQGGILEVTLENVEVKGMMTCGPPDLTPGRYLRLTVRDTGHGIPPEIQDRIFDPFFTTKKSGEGTGMGLAVVHGIVKGHKGAIHVESEAGKGTAFHVYLPQSDGANFPESREEKLSLGRNECILLVDDEETILRGLENMLGRIGYRVVATTDGREALKFFRTDPQGFDLVITDQAMPEMAGMELARKILSLRSDIPIILFTGYSEEVEEPEARAQGVQEFILKPLNITTLAQTIRKVLDGNDRRPMTPDPRNSMGQ